MDRFQWNMKKFDKDVYVTEHNPHRSSDGEYLGNLTKKRNRMDGTETEGTFSIEPFTCNKRVEWPSLAYGDAAHTFHNSSINVQVSSSQIVNASVPFGGTIEFKDHEFHNSETIVHSLPLSEEKLVNVKVAKSNDCSMHESSAFNLPSEGHFILPSNQPFMKHTEENKFKPQVLDCTPDAASVHSFPTLTNTTNVEVNMHAHQDNSSLQSNTIFEPHPVGVFQYKNDRPFNSMDLKIPYIVKDGNQSSKFSACNSGEEHSKVELHDKLSKYPVICGKTSDGSTSCPNNKTAVGFPDAATGFIENTGSSKNSEKSIVSHSLGECIPVVTKDPQNATKCETDQPINNVNVDKGSKIDSQKLNPKTLDILWDGSLQLNSSITVTALAIFKSGEKAPTQNWLKHVEMKGKVRLEAFEKFIQELPRSRTRALMVTSICWKRGSSESGLTSIMKQVSDNYEKGKKVGFAQPCPGTDLYVCPSSETIITILAKHGFFKGMSALIGDQDSLIGCVVWRRNSISKLDFKVTDKSKTSSSENPLESPDSSSLPTQTSSPLSNVQLSDVNNHVPCTILPVESPKMKPVNSNLKYQNAQSSKHLADVGASLTNATSISPNTESQNLTVIPAELLDALEYVSNLPKDPRKQLMELNNLPVKNISVVGKVESETRKSSIQELPNEYLSALESQQRNSKPDDDDLPEFDFNTYRTSEQPHLQHLRQMPVAIEKASNVSSHLLQPSSSHQQIVSEWENTEDKLPLPKLSTKECTEVIKAKGEEMKSNLSQLGRKGMWDDNDDDIPEWCPPDIRSKKQQRFEAIPHPPLAKSLLRSLVPFQALKYTANAASYPLGFTHNSPKSEGPLSFQDSSHNPVQSPRSRSGALGVESLPPPRDWRSRPS